MDVIKNDFRNKKNILALVVGILLGFMLLSIGNNIYSEWKKNKNTPNNVDEVLILKSKIANLEAQIAIQKERFVEVVEHLTSYQSKIDEALKEMLVSLEKIESKTNNSEKQ